MLNSNVKKTLSRYGLSPDEIKIYITILKLGSATVKEIAKVTKLNRTTVYRLADKLTLNGIVGKYHAKYGSHYTISNPETLITRLDDIRDETKEIIPQLKAIEKKEIYEPKTKFYRGREGYLSIINDSLQGYSHEILYLASAKDINDIISERFVTGKYIPTRIKRNIKFKQIVFPDQFSRQLQKKDHKELRQTKFLTDNFNFTANMLLYKNKVAYFTSKSELFCVVIESKEIAEMEREKFNVFWKSIN